MEILKNLLPKNRQECFNQPGIDHIIHFGYVDGESWIWVEVIEDNYIIEPLLQRSDDCYNNAENCCCCTIKAKIKTGEKIFK